MTDRTHAFTVVLDREYRVDDAESIVNAIMMVKGVIDVQPHISDVDFYTAREQAKLELRKKLFEVIYPERKIE